jgi:hypothetical protein
MLLYSFAIIPCSCWVPMTHTCNRSYSGGRDQEDHSSKSAQENSSQDPILKKPITCKKMTGGVAQSVGPEFKFQYHEKKKVWMEIDFIGYYHRVDIEYDFIEVYICVYTYFYTYAYIYLYIYMHINMYRLL